jgi:hypothetical protein
MSGYQNALAATLAPQAMGQQANVLASVMRPAQNQTQQTSQEPPKRKRSFAEVAGRIGDVLAIMGGREPIYDAFARRELADAQAQEQREVLVEFAGGAQTPQDVARAIARGIDPSALKALQRQSASGGAGPASIQEIEYLNNPNIPLEQRQQLAQFINNRDAGRAVIGSADTGFYTSPVFSPIAVPGQVMAQPAQSAPPAPTQAEPAAQAGNVFSMPDLQRVARSFPTAEAMMGWMQRNSVVVRVSSPQEAANLPRGTIIEIPGGQRKVVP